MHILLSFTNPSKSGGRDPIVMMAHGCLPDLLVPGHRPAYQKLLAVLQAQGVCSAPYELPETCPPVNHQRHHDDQPLHQQQQHAQHTGQPRSSAMQQGGLRHSSTVAGVKDEGQAAAARQQVYAHDVPFSAIAGLQPVSATGLLHSKAVQVCSVEQQFCQRAMYTRCLPCIA